MELKHSEATSPHRQLLQECPLSGDAPFEIHGASARGCQPKDDYLFQGFRYVLDEDRDVLVREDVRRWMVSLASKAN